MCRYLIEPLVLKSELKSGLFRLVNSAEKLKSLLMRIVISTSITLVILLESSRDRNTAARLYICRIYFTNI